MIVSNGVGAVIDPLQALRGVGALFDRLQTPGRPVSTDSPFSLSMTR